MEMEYRMEVNDSRIWEHRTDKPHKCNAIQCESEASYKALCNVTIKNPKGGYQDIESDVYFCKAHWETQCEYEKRTKHEEFVN